MLMKSKVFPKTGNHITQFSNGLALSQSLDQTPSSFSPMKLPAKATKRAGLVSMEAC